jgi:hypothetical protein
MIAGLGGSTPLQSHFINFLGDTNVPSRGLTPEMLSAIDATNGPATPPAAGGGNYDSQIADLRNQLAAMQAAKKPKQDPIYRGGEGSAGGRGGSAGGGGWGGH